MLILGDVLATLMIILGICASSWATLVGFSTLFPQQVESAAELILAKPWKMFFVGFAAYVVLGTIALIALNAMPIIRLLSLFIVAYLMTVSSIGLSGLARLMARRLMLQADSLSLLHAQNRSVMLLVLASIFPIFGWFVVVPVLLCLGFGAGVLAIRDRKAMRPSVAAPPIVPSH